MSGATGTQLQAATCLSLHYTRATSNCSLKTQAPRWMPWQNPEGGEQLQQFALVVFTQQKGCAQDPASTRVCQLPADNHSCWQDVGLSKPLLSCFTAADSSRGAAGSGGAAARARTETGSVQQTREMFLVAHPDTRLTEHVQGCRDVFSFPSPRAQHHLLGETAAC